MSSSNNNIGSRQIEPFVFGNINNEPNKPDRRKSKIRLKNQVPINFDSGKKEVAPSRKEMNTRHAKQSETFAGDTGYTNKFGIPVNIVPAAIHRDAQGLNRAKSTSGIASQTSALSPGTPSSNIGKAGSAPVSPRKKVSGIFAAAPKKIGPIQNSNENIDTENRVFESAYMRFKSENGEGFAFIPSDKLKKLGKQPDEHLMVKDLKGGYKYFRPEQLTWKNGPKMGEITAIFSDPDKQEKPVRIVFDRLRLRFQLEHLDAEKMDEMGPKAWNLWRDASQINLILPLDPNVNFASPNQQ